MCVDRSRSRRCSPPWTRVSAVTDRGFATARAVRRLFPLSFALIAAACGGGSGTSMSANAPTIANLRVSYSPLPIVGHPTKVTFLVDVTDADGDWVLGQCQFVTGDQVVVPVETSGLPVNATSGTALCSFIEIFLDELVAINLAIEDQAGHRSNVLSALADLEGRRPR